MSQKQTNGGIAIKVCSWGLSGRNPSKSGRFRLKVGYLANSGSPSLCGREALSLVPPEHFFQYVAPLGRQRIRSVQFAADLSHQALALEVLHQRIHQGLGYTERVANVLDPRLASFGEIRQDTADAIRLDLERRRFRTPGRPCADRNGYRYDPAQCHVTGSPFHLE